MLVGLACSIGCAPVTGTVQIVNAKLALAEAEDAGARRYATYEYTMAREYLRKAREEQGSSDFRASRLFSRKARRYAENALRQSESFLERSEKPVVLRATDAMSGPGLNELAPNEPGSQRAPKKPDPAAPLPVEPVQEAPGETR